MSIEAAPALPIVSVKEEEKRPTCKWNRQFLANFETFFSSFFAVFRWAKSSFDGFDSQTQIYDYSLYIFLKILLQQVLLPSSSQTLDIRENRKWQKVWASLRSHLCTKSSSTDVVHKTKTEKRGREITNYFTQVLEKSGPKNPLWSFPSGNPQVFYVFVRSSMSPTSFFF